MVTPDEKYLLDAAAGSTYRRMVQLLRPYAYTITSEDHETKTKRPIVIDLACGYGAIAELIENELGLHYVGVDLAGEWLTSLAERGFENHALDLAGEPSELTKTLLQIVGERTVLGLMMLDGLEHLVDTTAVLQAISDVARPHGALIGLSVPNVAHRDVGMKLALGRWDYTASGLLDRTHVRFFTEESLFDTLQRHGIHRIARNDLELELSDQHFPTDHSVLSEHTSVGALYRYVRQASANAVVNQFVWLCSIGPAAANADEPPVPKPFLSVILRTQGARRQQLRECLLSLSAQTDRDFEVLVVGHRLTSARRSVVTECIQELPDGVRERVTLLNADTGTRAHPLNVGFKSARGTYCVALDDDDFVLAHWVETFRVLALSAPGRVLRTRCASQPSRVVETRGAAATTASGPLTLPWTAHFSLAEHLAYNQTPFMSLAFPRSLWHDLNERFDETLTTTEDWDYLLRAASLLGIANTLEVTAVYRQWGEGDNSASIHRSGEWQANHAYIERKLDHRTIVLQAGEAAHIRRLVRESLENRPTPETMWHASRRYQLQLELVALINSRRWRATAPLRFMAGLVGKPQGVSLEGVVTADDQHLESMISALRRSRSWRLLPGAPKH